jgi:hypothetical protein
VAKGNIFASTPGWFNFHVDIIERIQELKKELVQETEVAGINKKDDTCGEFVSAAIQSLEVADLFLRAAKNVQNSPTLLGHESISCIIAITEIIRTLPSPES